MRENMKEICMYIQYPCARPCALLLALPFESYGSQVTKSINQFSFNEYYGVKKQLSTRNSTAIFAD